MFRGHLKGLSIEALAGPYLPPKTDLRAAKAELRWVRGELIALAHRSGFAVERALLTRSAARVVAPARSAPPKAAATRAPSLDEYRLRHGDFYTEAELIEKYIEEFPAATKQSVRRTPEELRAHLIDRQVTAVNRLANKVGDPPNLSDRVHAWLPIRVADRLRSAGVICLADIYLCVERRGALWWRLVPKLGPRGAEDIEHWWSHYVASLGRLPPSSTANTPKATAQPLSLLEFALSSGPPLPSRDASEHASRSPAPLRRIRPILEVWGQLPRSLQGSPQRPVPETAQGVRASDDLQAVVEWLRAKRGASPATLRSYAREAERLLLWAVAARGAPLSSLTAGDLASYVEFLGQPEPVSRWVSSRRAPFSSVEWRPFVAGLSNESTALACRILESMFDYLVTYGYLVANPWREVATSFVVTPRSPDARHLSMTGWLNASRRGLRGRLTPRQVRDEFVVRFLYATGLRLTELRLLRVGCVRYMPQVSAWVLSIRGKGNKVRSVPLGPDTVELLVEYLRSSRTNSGGLGGDLAVLLRALPADQYVVARVPDDQLVGRFVHSQTAAIHDQAGSDVCGVSPVSQSTVYRACQRFFREAVERLPELSPEDRAAMLSASTHWMRHTFATHALGDGVELLVLRDLLGHASIATTNQYVHSDLRSSTDAVVRASQRRAERERGQ